MLLIKSLTGRPNFGRSEEIDFIWPTQNDNNGGKSDNSIYQTM